MSEIDKCVPRIAILLCTRNAEAFLNEQMESYFSQDYNNWELWVSDDGSTDRTLDIVRDYKGRKKKITIVDGPCRGATANFLSLTERIKGDVDYFAWSDADDIWLPDKLSRAVKRMAAMDNQRPVLYCGRTEIVDAANRIMYQSVLYKTRPCFQNALCQNIGSGNTMAFNRVLRDLLVAGGVPEVPYHDWWAYVLATGCGGDVYYDPVPCLRYRQHGGNLTGCDLGRWAKLRRGMRLIQGGEKKHSKAHIEALCQRMAQLIPENMDILKLFAETVDMASVGRRLQCFHRSGVHRQSLLHSCALYIAVALGKYP